MNEFNQEQLDVISSLARTYYQQFASVSLKFVPPADLIALQNRYVEDIIKGLTDPDYWGYDES